MSKLWKQLKEKVCLKSLKNYFLMIVHLRILFKSSLINLKVFMNLIIKKKKNFLVKIFFYMKNSQKYKKLRC